MTRRAARARLLALAATLATVVAVLALTGSLSAQRLRDDIESFGVAAPLAYIVVSSLLTVVLFPGPLLSAAAGLLFGTALGTPVAIVSATLGAVLAFGLSRWWAHDAVEHLAGDRLNALRAWVGRRGFLSVLYARIAPGVPYSLVNYAAGLTPIRLRSFAAATAVGCAPRAFAYVALGGSFGDFGSPETIAAVVVLVAMAVGGLVLARSGAATASGPGTGSSSPAAPTAGPR